MLFRVTEPGVPAFRLRKAEEGISVFDSDAVQPPLTEAEVLGGFRPGSSVVARSPAEVAAKGLRVIPVPGAGFLPQRIRDSHAEIRPFPGMTRVQFKQALRGLE
jgi:hypothetical protein